MKIDESYVARRRFLCSMLGGGTAALASGAVVPLTYYAGNLRPEPLPDSIVIEDPGLKPGEATMIKYGGRLPVLLIMPRRPGSTLKVLVAVCTHFDCTVSYQNNEQGEYIHCACHEGRFDLDGQVTDGPPPEPLEEFHCMELADGTLVIAPEKENLEKALEEPDA